MAGAVGVAVARGSGIVAPLMVIICSGSLAVVPAVRDGIVNRKAVEVLRPRIIGDGTAKGGKTDHIAPTALVTATAFGFYAYIVGGDGIEIVDNLVWKAALRQSNGIREAAGSAVFNYPTGGISVFGP